MVTISIGSCNFAVDLAGEHLRLTDGELEALSSHRLDQHRKLELPATLHLKVVGALGLGHPQRDVPDDLGVEAALQAAAR